MIYYKILDGDFVVAIGTSDNALLLHDHVITEAEHNAIADAIRFRPKAPDGFRYRLRDGTLVWELAELPPIEPEPPTDEEALTRYANELTGADDPDLLSAAETLITQRIKEDT